MQGDRNDDLRPMCCQCVRPGGRQQTAELFREWFTGFQLEPNHGVAQPPVIRSEPYRGVEVESRTPALRATFSEVGVRADRTGAPRAGQSGVGREFRPTRVAEGGGAFGLTNPTVTRPDEVRNP
jgi:hypothetical protein